VDNQDVQRSTGLSGVTVTYGNTVALDDVTLLVGPGEIVVVLGPSGSGKSTLLRALAGLVPLTSGTILVDGEDVTGAGAQSRGLAMVFEEAAVLPFTDVEGNLGWGPRVRNVPPEQIEQRVAEQARGLRLSRLLKRRPRTLSAGENHRVGIGRALVHHPTGFLFDEPLAHLDAGERARVRRRIVEVVRPLGVSTFYVTHDQVEAMAIADRIALLDQGRIVQVATPRELYDRPVDLLAAMSLGEMGLIRAVAVRSGFRIGTRVLPLWRPLPAGLENRTVLIGLRPEDVRDADRPGHPADPSAVTVPAHVVRVERTGADTVVTLTVIGDDEEPARLTARVSREVAWVEGQQVSVAIDARRVHVFDPDDGLALFHAEP
jgi:ABC-type sugar transport system ATPase subunit